MKDNTLTVTGAMPNAANTVNTALINLTQQAVRPFNTGFRVRISNTAATGANSKNVNYAIYGTNESNGANAVLARPAFVVAGNAANHNASNRDLYLQPDFDKLYIFGSATGEANGGNAADGTFTVEIVI